MSDDAGDLSGAAARGAASARLARRTLRQWPLIVACALVAAVAGYVASSSQTKQYEATTTMQLNEVDLPSLFLAQNLQQPGQDAPAKAATNAELVMLPSVRELTARSLHGVVSAADLARDVTVTTKTGTTLLSITARSPDRRLASLIADGMRKSFILTRTRSATAKFERARASLQTQLAGLGTAERRSAAGTVLANRIDQIDTLTAVSDGGVETVQSARASTTPVSPRPKRDAILALLAGGIIGVGITMLRARFDDRIRDADELAELWPLPALGLIPETSGLKDVGRGLPTAAALEAFGLARTNLRYLHVGGDIKTLLVTSAVAGEGKSTVALNLAVAAALADLKVLLLEGDLRRPVVAGRIGLASRHGLSEVLAGIAEFDDAVTTVAFGQPRDGMGAEVDVVAAGLVPPSPSALLERAGIGELLTAARARYDLVIIDSPPATIVGDAKALASHADGIVVVSRLGRLRRSAFERLRDLLDDLETPVLGTIVNGGASSSAYGYSSYTSVAPAEAPAPAGASGAATAPSQAPSG